MKHLWHYAVGVLVNTEYGSYCIIMVFQISLYTSYTFFIVHQRIRGNYRQGKLLDKKNKL
jgi:hypothetical protein